MTEQITARRLLTATGFVEHPLITFEDGKIAQITSLEATSTKSATRDLGEVTLAPAFLDVHVHGAANHDVMEGTPEAIGHVSQFLASRGVGRYLATTVTAPLDTTLRALEGIARLVESQAADDAAQPIGIHLEGPFLSHVKRGVHPPEHLLEPSVQLFNRFWEAARGQIRLITVAPELPGAAEMIARAVELGVRVSMGHSDATLAEAKRGAEAGAVTATHTFNAMRALDHREPGILGFVLDDEALYAELICDDVHVAPELVRLWLKAKGSQRGILVTDGMAATGMPDGEYKLGDLAVTVANGRAMHDGALAGSVLTMDRAVENVQRFTGCTLEDAVRMAAMTPGAMLGLPAAVSVGSAADFNLFSQDGRRIGSMLRGRMLA